MNPRQVYSLILKKATADPVVRSGMKLANRVKLFQALAEKPLAPRALSTQLHMKDRYIWELSQAMVATGVISMEKSGELYIPRDCIQDLLAATEKAEWEPHLLKTLPILDQCFPEDGKSGYTLDEAPYVLDLINKVRSPYTPKIVAELTQAIKNFHPGSGNIKDVLDVGCGTGDITIPLAKQMEGASVFGCDTSEKAITSALENTKGVPNLSFVKVDGGAYPKDWMKKFDVILMFDVLHDLPYPEETMTEIMKVLKDDGIMVILDPEVSNNPLNNVGNLQAANALTFSSFYCVPSSCCHDHSSALGISWGKENKEIFLNKMGLEVKHKISLLGSLFYHTFVCVKTPKK